MARKETEDEIRRLCSGRRFDLAATLMLNEYGSEISRFLRSRLRSDGNGREVFAMFCEDLWRALPGFEFRCSSRTWVYVLARHAELRFRAEPEGDQGSPGQNPSEITSSSYASRSTIELLRRGARRPLNRVTARSHAPQKK